LPDKYCFFLVVVQTPT